jgi:uncharacterized membrane-anchored protein YjiN (DUF445 family)
MNTLLDKISEIKTQISQYENEIREQIYNVIKEVSKKHSRPKTKANTFTISFSEMSKNNVWSPTFYDYEEMERLLLEKLDKSNAINLIDVIDGLYEDRQKNGVCVLKLNSYTYPIRTEFIKEILDEIYKSEIKK